MKNQFIFTIFILLSFQAIIVSSTRTRRQFLQSEIQIEATCSCLSIAGFEPWGAYCTNNCNSQISCSTYSSYCYWNSSTTTTNTTNTTTLSCLNNCSSKGVCNTTTGVCVCYTGYLGIDCSTMTCPNNCSSHGTCNSSTGICTCASGYTGTNCNTTVVVSCPNNCSAHGSCNTTSGVCTCSSGYSGTNCNTTTVVSCPNNCSSHGSCNTLKGVCTCSSGYTGTSCNTTTVVSCPNNCSSHGTCNTSTGVCTCSSGYSGSNCNTTTVLSCPNNCSGQGTCNTTSGVCTCYSGYIGTNCSTSNTTVETWDGTATTTRYYDCSGGSCGCSYGNEQYPTFCESNAMFKAPAGNIYGAKFYGTAAASQALGGGDWMALACGQCYKISGSNNVGTFSGTFGTSTAGQQTTIVVKITDYCPPDNTVCSGTKKHFDIIAVGFDWPDFSLSNTCAQSYSPTHSLAQKYQPCSQWMDTYQDPTKNCDCSKITESDTLRNGCNNFLSLGWDNPVVNYKKIPCPLELQMAPPCSDTNSLTPPQYCSAPPTIISA